MDTTVKNYYELLGVDPASGADEIKRAFRQQIARYHPDKVQHLGKEFQDMAADRAAELTEAYRMLSNASLRAEYDRARQAAAPVPAPSRPAHAAEAQPREEKAPGPVEEQPATGSANRFSQERATRDEFVRKAVLGRFKQAMTMALGNTYDDSEFRGFDLACVPKPKLFGGTRGPRLLGRFVPRVDGDAVADAWTQAGKWGAANEEICVFLMGSSIAPPRELASMIAEQKRKPSRGGRVTLIPVDARDWDAHVPVDAPPVVKKLLARLKSGI